MCPNFSIASPTLVTVHFLIITLVIGMKWYITVVLIFDSQMINGVECFFIVNSQANSQIYIKMQRAKNSQDILGKKLKE